MSGPSRAEREAARAVSEVARRAVRRLDVLEWLIIGGAIAIAVVGGWLVAWLVAPRAGSAFRVTWIATSLLLFVVPGGIVLLKSRREERAARQVDRAPREGRRNRERDRHPEEEDDG